VDTIVLTCPGMETMRLWPLPVQQPVAHLHGILARNSGVQQDRQQFGVAQNLQPLSS